MRAPPQAACLSRCEREELLLALDILQLMAARRLQPAAVGLREGVRDDDIAPERLAHALDARGGIGGCADDGELEPLAHADVAVGDLAEVQADAIADRHAPGICGVVGADALAG